MECLRRSATPVGRQVRLVGSVFSRDLSLSQLNEELVESAMSNGSADHAADGWDDEGERHSAEEREDQG